MSFEHSPNHSDIEQTPIPFSIEGDDGVEETPTFEGLESFKEALDAHDSGLDDVDDEVETLTAELEVSDLPTQEIAKKIEGLTTRSTAGKVATFFAILAGAGAMAHTQTADAASAREVRQVSASIQKHNTNQMQVVRLQGQLAEIDLRQESLLRQIAELSGSAGQNQEIGAQGLSESDIKRMDTAFEAEVANLDVERLTALEELNAQTLSQPIREAKQKQIEATHAAKVAELADKYNDQKNQEAGKDLDPREQQREMRDNQRDDRKMDSLRRQLLQLEMREKQIRMKIYGQQVRGLSDDVVAIISNRK